VVRGDTMVGQPNMSVPRELGTPGDVAHLTDYSRRLA
jgi:hypothetical protein